MKRIFGIIIICVSMVIVNHAYAKLPNHAIGLQLGFNETIFRVNSPTIIQPKDPNILSKDVMDGFKIGCVYDVNFYKGLGCVVSLNYSFGANIQDWQDYYYNERGIWIPQPIYQNKSTTMLHKLDIAFDMQYKIEIAKDTWLLAYTGPTIQGVLALSENNDFRGKIDKKEPIVPIVSHPSKVVQYYNPFNVSWGIGIGFQYEKYFIRGGYDFGLVNPLRVEQFNEMNFNGVNEYKGDDRYVRGRNDQWQIKIGMYLWQK